MKRFTPKVASLTKKQIWDFFYEKSAQDRDYFYEVATQEVVDTPEYKPSEMDDKLCQRFVDAEFNLTDEGYDREEDRVEARFALVEDFHELFVRRKKK